MKFPIPDSIKIEHETLHDALLDATKEGGETGDAAMAVALVLHPHFVKEEEYALPPLGLLQFLAKGKATPEMSEVICLIERLKADLPMMLEEHKAIGAALKKLNDAATREHKPVYVKFVEKLLLHAKNEEEVLYPAALVLGDYLKIQLKRTIKAA